MYTFYIFQTGDSKISFTIFDFLLNQHYYLMILVNIILLLIIPLLNLTWYLNNLAENKAASF
jgi:hypothetical protein